MTVTWHRATEISRTDTVKETTDDKNHIRKQSEKEERQRKMAFIIWPEKDKPGSQSKSNRSYAYVLPVSPLPQSSPWDILSPTPQPNYLHPLVCLYISVGWKPNPKPGIGSFTAPTHWFHTHYQVLSMPHRLLGETVSLLVTNLWISVKQEREVENGAPFYYQCLRESLEAAGSCSSHHNPVLFSSKSSPNPAFNLRVELYRGRSCYCPRICLGSLTAILETLRLFYQGARGSYCPRGQWEL